MPWNIETNNPSCNGYAVVDEKGQVVGCHQSFGDARGQQQALYSSEPTAKGDPGVSDVHVDSIMKPSRRRRQMYKAQELVEGMDSEQLKTKLNYVSELLEVDPTDVSKLLAYHVLVNELKPFEGLNGFTFKQNDLVKNTIVEIESTRVETDNEDVIKMLPSVVGEMIRDAYDNGYAFADVVATLSMNGYAIHVVPIEQEYKEDMDETISKIKVRPDDELDYLPLMEKETYTPPQAVRDEAKRALNWISEGHAGANFTSVGRRRASQLANGEPVSIDTIKRMNSFLSRHEVDKKGQGFSQGEKGYPSPGRVSWAAWGGDAAKSWVNSIYRKLDLDKSVFVFKKEDERRFTLGPWYIPDQQDAHNEFTDSVELQQGLWNYVKNGDRAIRLQHNRDVVAGEWVEVLTWPYEINVPMTTATGLVKEVSYPPNTVFMGVVWEPWAWELVKMGKIRGYSIGGQAQRIMVDLPEDENE